ncbi:hypothetical protein [Tenacibaculum ovolyticum]|uniref:hypothetical protein n=1 Tax=Tenacibaculum ovolyticum TaxID=104270 RepID=UPI001F3E2DA3|nr:hypothetical protein [Tenacibaculum ovolyticum]
MKNFKKVVMSLFFITIVCFIGCSKENDSLNDNLETHNFEDYINSLSEKFSKEGKVVAVEFNFVNDTDIEILKTVKLDETSATLALMTSSSISDKNLYQRGGKGCSKKDISKGNCYQITCTNNGKSTTGKCTGGVFGSCLSIGKDCLNAGGCTTLCKIPAKIIYIPGELTLEDIEEGEMTEVDLLDQIILIPGQK